MATPRFLERYGTFVGWRRTFDPARSPSQRWLECGTTTRSRTQVARRSPTIAPCSESQTCYSSLHGRRPSHLELLDNKPKLGELTGSHARIVYQGAADCPIARPGIAMFGSATLVHAMRSSRARDFECASHIQKIADDICIVRSLVTEQINHDPAHTFMNTELAFPDAPYGVVGPVWFGKRRRRASRLCGPGKCWWRPGTADCSASMALWFSSESFSGRTVPNRR